MPLARAAALPRLLWPPDTGLEYARMRRPDPTLLEDREVYMQSYSSDMSEAAVHMRRWQREVLDVDFHVIFLESVFTEEAHAALVDFGWKLFQQE